MEYSGEWIGSLSTDGRMNPTGEYTNEVTFTQGYYKIIRFYLKNDVNFTHRSSTINVAKQSGSNALY
ncbi:hypothetical protein LEP1GSC195_2221 [Leptospira wolbachii serovar Codice str. CDC]|uniref:Uncharacterized protein n=1 Tax=Leptospira wolbachii serovar Codice str. CDC TaxID=1218599 RepID=R9A4H1_9LEPT|nr:hypothetical protein LEP1GSC195_2221 [Leptospira wolbachii serovar Codice str. CDC]